MSEATCSRRSVLRATAVLGTAGAALLAGAEPGWAGTGDSSGAVSDPAEDFATMRAQWRALHVTSGYDPSDPEIASVLSVIDDTARKAWESMNTATDRAWLWEDARIETDQSFAISRSFWRLYTMALGWATEGTALAGNTELLADTIAGLDWMVAHYYREDGEIVGNWYEWQISGPMAFNDAVVLLFGELSPEQVDAYARSVANFTPEPSGTAANRALTATVVVGRGALAGDADAVEKGVEGLHPVLAYVDSGDGFYRDGSFIQHEHYPYIGAYGASILEALVPILTTVAGTSWQVDAPIVYDWLEDAIDPFLFRGALADMVSGRTIARWNEHEHYHGHYVLAPALRLLPNAPADRLTRLRSMVKEWLIGDDYDDSTPRGNVPVLLAARELKADDTAERRGPLVMSKVFVHQDRIVHRRPEWMLGIAMYSSRIADFESINDENLRGWHTASGATYLYTGSSGQFMDGFWATVDHARIPGTTTVVRERADAEGAGTLSPHDWVGGASLDGRYTAGGMALSEVGSSLTCRKSWFCFDDEVVALGAAITAQDGHPVETVVENRRLEAGGLERVVADGSEPVPAIGDSTTVQGARWLHLAGTGGYVFPTAPATVRLERQERTGRWSDVTRHPNWADDTPLTRAYLIAVMEHGTDPENSTYAYVMLPAASLERTRRYSAHPAVEVSANTGDVQAVRHREVGVLAANFWAPARVEGVHATGACALVLRRTAGETSLAVADPARGEDGFTVVVAGRHGEPVEVDSGLRVVALNPLTVEVEAGTEGRTLQLRLGRA